MNSAIGRAQIQSEVIRLAAESRLKLLKKILPDLSLNQESFFHECKALIKLSVSEDEEQKEVHRRKLRGFRPFLKGRNPQYLQLYDRVMRV